MTKLTDENKIKIYEERKEGKTLTDLARIYNVNTKTVQYIVRLIETHGYDILKDSRNRNYTLEDKKRIINRILINNEAVTSVSIEEGFSTTITIRKWIKKYKENGYNIVERKRGRTTMSKKVTKEKKNETVEEKIKRLEEENEYLRAELEYSKKLRAVVQARKNRQQKKK